jgi:hypothetical protein
MQPTGAVLSPSSLPQSSTGRLEVSNVLVCSQRAPAQGVTHLSRKFDLRFSTLRATRVKRTKSAPKINVQERQDRSGLRVTRNLLHRTTYFRFLVYCPIQTLLNVVSMSVTNICAPMQFGAHVLTPISLSGAAGGVVSGIV